MIENLKQKANELKENIVDFTQKLIQVQSLSGNEEHIAELIAYQLKNLGYDEVFLDEVGNITGIIKGELENKDIVFSAHLDHSIPVEKNLWEHEPYSGFSDDEFIYGVGASDCKSAISAQIYTGYILKNLGLLKKGNYIVSFTVQEGSATCFGTKYLYKNTFKEKDINPKLVVLGNASSLNINIGHKGRLEIEIVVYGRTNHSIIPKLGINAIYKANQVIRAIEDLADTLPVHSMLGDSSIAVTNIKTLPDTISVIPDRCILSIDRRFLPFETLEEVIGQLQAILDKIAQEDSTFKAEINIKKEIITSYTGFKEDSEKIMLPFLTNPEADTIKNIFFELKKLNEHTNFSSWYFNTDGGYIGSFLKIPTIGYSAGEEKYYETPFEKVSIKNILENIVGNCLIYNVY
ncbi:MAG: M20/M25/M40 family metallo-hydrolase [Candidatus Sericytochromatia bacterium]